MTLTRRAKWRIIALWQDLSDERLGAPRSKSWILILAYVRNSFTVLGRYSRIRMVLFYERAATTVMIVKKLSTSAQLLWKWVLFPLAKKLDLCVGCGNFWTNPNISIRCLPLMIRCFRRILKTKKKSVEPQYLRLWRDQVLLQNLGRLLMRIRICSFSKSEFYLEKPKNSISQ